MDIIKNEVVDKDETKIVNECKREIVKDDVAVKVLKREQILNPKTGRLMRYGSDRYIAMCRDGVLVDPAFPPRPKNKRRTNKRKLKNEELAEEIIRQLDYLQEGDDLKEFLLRILNKNN
jgi:hypothetical protein